MKRIENDELERKLKIERVTACLNCKRFVKCENIGQYEECCRFLEVELEQALIIVSLTEFSKC